MFFIFSNQNRPNLQLTRGTTIKTGTPTRKPTQIRMRGSSISLERTRTDYWTTDRWDVVWYGYCAHASDAGVSRVRSDQIGLSLPSPPRLGVWYGYCAHASDAGVSRVGSWRALSPIFGGSSRGWIQLECSRSRNKTNSAHLENNNNNNNKPFVWDRRVVTNGHGVSSSEWVARRDWGT